jgi:hypothetical protein
VSIKHIQAVTGWISIYLWDLADLLKRYARAGKNMD